jgi:serine/threonine-protein kinase
MVGQVFLGKYVVVAPLTEGGMSRLFLARQARTGQEVVIKLLKDEYLVERETVEYFRREILVSTQFRHPHAVCAIDSAANSRFGPVMVMEFLRGVDLHELMCQLGRFTVARTAGLLVQLCDVLQAAHEAGVVHRDLKPGNCMILSAGTPREMLKLMDFGLAQMRSVLYIAPEEVDDPRLRAAAGTPEYMCPELVCGKETDHRGDLYAVGVILFEMLSGHRPFEAATPDELMLAHVKQEPPRFADVGLRDAIPPGVEAVVQRCLAKSPADRPASASELALLFTKAAGGLPPPSRTPAPSAAAGLAGRPGPGPAVTDKTAYRQRIDAVMPEALALVKVKGFIHDLGGSVVESVPGMIRVRLPDPHAPSGNRSGLFSRRQQRPGPVSALQAVGATDVELHLEREDPSQPSRLTVTLLMRPAGSGLATPAWWTRCNQIGRDLQAYLMQR